MFLAFDTETVRNEKADDFFKLGLAKPDRRLVDSSKIKVSLDKKYQKCGLSWWLGKATCICAHLIDADKKFECVDKDEKALLVRFGEFLSGMDAHVSLIGKNSKTFDFPFLTGRYMANNIGIPPMINRRNRNTICDVDEMFAPFGRNEQTAPLVNYAWGMGIGGKTDGSDGSMVQAWYDDDKLDLIKSYCIRDVEIVVEMVKRFRPFEPEKIHNVRGGVEL